MDVEAQILDGGGMAKMGGRGQWRSSEIEMAVVEGGSGLGGDMRPSPLQENSLSRRYVRCYDRFLER